MKKSIMLSVALCFGSSAFASKIEGFPILEKLEASGVKLSDDTHKWMKRWKGLDLEEPGYTYPELGGHTSVTLKIRKPTPEDPKGKSYGSFTPRNGAGNPNTGIAYFNLAAILGYDAYFRPGIRYEAGPRTSAALKSAIARSGFKGKDRIINRDKILGVIASGNPVKGYIKAGHPDSAVLYDAIANPGAAPNGAPVSSNTFIRFLQASNPKPTAGTIVAVTKGYSGDALELAREYSVIMTLDSVLGQWDRYSGGNLAVIKDDNGRAHFYAIDSDGSDIGSTPSWNLRNLGWFSRYDKKVIAQLSDIYTFLNKPSTGYLGYTDAEKFVVDLGLYFEQNPASYVERLKRNLKLLLDQVAANQHKYGEVIYL